jgi:hypothetical protein
MEAFFKRLIWPQSVSRLPPSVCFAFLVFSFVHRVCVQIAQGKGSVKADQWRSQVGILFVALFDAWQVDGEIPDINAPESAPNTKNAAAQAAAEKLLRARLLENLKSKNPNPSEVEINQIKSATMDRSLRRHYDNVVEFSVATRTLTSYSISPNDVKRGCAALCRSAQTWARMGCHLTPYYHLCMHLEPQFLRLGPCPGWWVFPYERNNGFLGRFNHNGHSGGEMEGTMMRGWWKTIFIQDLV